LFAQVACLVGAMRFNAARYEFFRLITLQRSHLLAKRW
jgi:hypothetical protein